MNKVIGKLATTLLFLFLTIYSSAQYYNAGQERAGIKWRSITSEHFEIIYPDYFEQEAMNVAKKMELSYEYTCHSLDHHPKKASIVLHPNTSLSNGFMTWAPKRIEMYATPNQGIYTQDWIEQLAIHEFRHFVQFSKMDKEIPQWLKILFGDQATVVVAALWLPSWILEGDAVTTETALSSSGRGRQPDFIRQTKALLVEDDFYSYDKAYLGSYKDFVPNYYQMGFFVVAGTRELGDTLVWDNVLHRIARNPFRLNALSHALKKEIGMNKTQLYDSIYKTMKQKWSEEYKSNEYPEYEQLSPQIGKKYTDYLYPSKRSNGNIVAYKEALDQTCGFVEITPEGKEKNLFKTGNVFKESATIQKDQIAWCEYAYDTRWEHDRGTLLRIFDIEGKKVSDFRYKTKLFAPAFSSDNKKIVTVEVDNQYKSHLTIIDAKTGECLQKIATDDNQFFITPTWSNNDQEIITVALKNSQRSMIKYSIKEQKFETIKEASTEEFIHPCINGDTLFYISGKSGTSQIVAMNLKSGKIYQQTDVPFGIGQYSIDNGQLIFNNYTSDGYTICQKETDFSTLESDSAATPYLFTETISKQEKGIIPFDQYDSITYQSKPYSKLGHALNFHSWSPLYIDPYTQTASPGISIMSQNKLSTTELTAGYKYDFDDKVGQFKLDLKYKGLYPIIDFAITTGRKKSTYFEVQKHVDYMGQLMWTDTTAVSFDWQQTTGDLSVEIPINLSKGKWSRYLEPSFGYSFSLYNYDESLPINLTNFFHYGYANLHYQQILKSSEQDLLPNFGIIANVRGARSIRNDNGYGSIYVATSTLYLPGIMPNHGIQVYYGYQKKHAGDYTFGDIVQNPRGYTSESNYSMMAANVNYMFPICYPDWSLGGILYMRRIKASLFYDWSRSKALITNTLQDVSYDRSSVGVDLKADINVLRFGAPIEVGGRFAYLIGNRFYAGYLLSIDFNF